MAIPTIKSTYSLDVETVRQLGRLVKHRKTFKAAARRRILRTTVRRRYRNRPKAVALRRTPRITVGRRYRNISKANEGLEALDRLQRRLNLDQRAAADWENEVKLERHAVS